MTRSKIPVIQVLSFPTTSMLEENTLPSSTIDRVLRELDFSIRYYGDRFQRGLEKDSNVRLILSELCRYIEYAGVNSKTRRLRVHVVGLVFTLIQILINVDNYFSRPQRL
jgi:hypothetical protein